jgi:formylglycine-generating enzyme required for sulfatase activity
VKDQKAEPTPPTANQPYNVFVSSTYRDNKERRRLVREAITRAGMVWHGMEIFDASTKPTVEECLRLAGEADLLVGIVAWRYGWIPEGQEKSITELEYEANPERLMFILDDDLPVNPAADFDQDDDQGLKYSKLLAFKKRIRADQMPAPFTETTLQARVLAALQKWQKEREAPAEGDTPDTDTAPPPPPAPDLDAEIRDYRQKAESLHGTLPVAGFASQLKVPINIEEIYVPLRAMVDLRGVADAPFADAAQAEEVLRGSRAGLEISMPEAFRQSDQRDQKGIVILGDPGSGKTTHLKRVLLWCLRNRAPDIGLPEQMLPVFLPLRELDNLERGLDYFIEQQLASPHLKTSQGFGRRMLQRGHLLLLLDGLDEVAAIERRQQVSQWITEALRSHPSCRFVVTCRFAGYDKRVRMSADFLEMHLRPLSEEQVEQFVHSWYRIVEKGLAEDPDQAEGIAAEKAARLVARLKESDFRARRVFELTRNPLLLTNICLVHRHRGSLPQKRARLYEECIDVLLEHWRGSKGLEIGVAAADGRRVLQPAAYWMHGREGRTRATADELAPHIESALKAVNWQGGGSKPFLNTIRNESGLLTGWDQEHYGFMHLGFQEYLAAREIRRLHFGGSDALKRLAAQFGDSWWQEVGLLLLALEEPSLFVPYMREVVRQPAFARHSDLVELCLDDAAETSPQPFVELLETAPASTGGFWKRLLGITPPAEQRPQDLWDRQLAALKILERMDSTRVDQLSPSLSRHPSEGIRRWLSDRAFTAGKDALVNIQDEYELVKIPGDSFMMGSPENEEGRFDWEGPPHPVQVPGFYMGRYPVTNAQYGKFLAENPEAAEPEYWSDRSLNQPRQPVVGISWEEARAYARWADLRLPTEAEWEYACRAGSTTRYHSGNSETDLDRVGWYEKNSEGQLHPVGEKEANAFGLYDMHGNVWEWVEDDWHDDYQGAPDDGRAWIDDSRGAQRVIRGGGWGDVAHGCRSAARGSISPGNRITNLGFRLSRPLALGP